MPSTVVIIFGATGDLAQQKLLPALLKVASHPALWQELSIVAIGRRPYDTEQFLEFTHNQATARQALSPEEWANCAERISYYRMDFNEVQEYAQLGRYLDELGDSNRLFYLSVPPQSYGQILDAISLSSLHQPMSGSWRRIIVEKPFGHDQASATQLNQQIEKLFVNDQVYRIDHYLAKETVQNLLAFRFANQIFESVWNKDHVDHIQITVAEEEGIKGRGSYYDQAGAFRDLVQNHILQLLALLTMEEPTSFSFAALADEKIRLLSQLEFDPTQSVFGQYEGYRQEGSVHPESQTETYGMACLAINSPRWTGVPIYLRTGKKLATRVSEISLQFKEPRQHLFQWAMPEKAANVLTFRLQPDEGIALRLGIKTPRHNLQVQPVQMEFCYSAAFKASLPDAYERLFLDVLQGDRTLSLREDGIEASWALIDRLLADKPNCPLLPYTGGSWGPPLADQLLQQTGRSWLTHDSRICNGVTVESIN